MAAWPSPGLHPLESGLGSWFTWSWSKHLVQAYKTSANCIIWKMNCAVSDIIFHISKCTEWQVCIDQHSAHPPFLWHFFHSAPKPVNVTSTTTTANSDHRVHPPPPTAGADLVALINLGYSLADRDANNKTARDIAEENELTQNVEAIGKLYTQSLHFQTFCIYIYMSHCQDIHALKIIHVTREEDRYAPSAWHL